MENYKKLTPIELNKIINDVKKQHDDKKIEINNKLNEVDEMEKSINENIKELGELESKYVELISILMEKSENAK